MLQYSLTIATQVKQNQLVVGNLPSQHNILGGYMMGRRWENKTI